MKKTGLLLFVVGVFFALAFASCSKSCDCKLKTSYDTYEHNYHLDGYGKYGVSDCNGLARHLEQAAWENGGEEITVTCTANL